MCIRDSSSTVDQGLRVGADLAGEGDEDAMDLSLFLFEEADQLVILLDGF